MYKEPPHQGTGMRWVPVLAVCLCLLLLAGLLISTIYAARESARKFSCQGNLAQIAVALHEYHDTYGVLPPSGFYLSHAQSNNPYVEYETGRGGRLLRLVPYMAATPIYDFMSNHMESAGTLTDQPGGFNRTRYNGFLGGKAGARPLFGEVRHKVQPWYNCPSAVSGPYLDDGSNAAAISNYGFSIGAQRMDSNRNSCRQFPGNPFQTGTANMGLSVLEHQISGPFSRSTWSARFKDMLDGQSNLIMVGEILPEKSRFMARGWMHCDANWAATTAPINYPSRDRWDYVRTRDCRWYDNWQTSQGFKSQHPDGANFAMADGSYRFIRSDIDYLTYQRLGDRNDGQDVAHR